MAPFPPPPPPMDPPLPQMLHDKEKLNYSRGPFTFDNVLMNTKYIMMDFHTVTIKKTLLEARRCIGAHAEEKTSTFLGLVAYLSVYRP